MAQRTSRGIWRETSNSTYRTEGVKGTTVMYAMVRIKNTALYTKVTLINKNKVFVLSYVHLHVLYTVQPT